MISGLLKSIFGSRNDRLLKTYRKQVERINALENLFKQTLLAVTPEFQTEFGYDLDEPGKANMTVATAWVGEQFNCLAYTVEMPFKDNANLPDDAYGWSDIRSMKLGQDMLPAILAVTDKLR